MSENKRTGKQSVESVKRKTSAGQTTVRKSGTAGAKRTTSSGVKKKRAVTGKSVKKRKKSAQKLFDLETLVALVLILLTLVGAVVLIVSGIKNCDNVGGAPKEVDYVVNADIRPQETETPVPTAEPAPTEEFGGVITAEATAEIAVTATATPVSAVVNVKDPNRQLRSATIRTIGDFVIHDVVFKSAKRMGTSTMQYDFAPMLSYVKNYIANADFTVANVDGCLGGKDAFRYGYSGYPQFNTPEHILYALKDCGVDMLTLANNHMLDGWFDGLQKTIKNVEAAGFYHVGANRSQEEKNSAYIVEINGIKVGFMNYTVSLNSMDTQKSLDKRAMEFGVNATKNSDAAADAARLRSAGAEVIVCFMHWGEEYKSAPDSNQEFLASNLVKAGVDVIMGGHPHQVQPAKWLSGTNQFGENQKTLCVYSIGNFLSDQRGEATSGGIMYDFTIQEKADGSFEITSPAYLPVWVWRTGTGDNDRNYYVLPTQDYLKTRPAGMSNSDYELMLSNYNSTLNVMQKGVGNLISK